MSRKYKKGTDGFIDFCQSSPEVIECHRISGEFNYMLKIIVDSIQSLEKFGNRCNKYGIYTILIVLSSYKFKPTSIVNKMFLLSKDGS